MSFIDSALEIVPLEYFKNLKDQEHKTCFSEGELEEVAAGGFRTAAGFLAVKRALVKLTGDNIGPSSFALSHKESGEPVILSAPPGVEIDTFRISISHTRDYAYGFAVRRKNK